MMHWNRESIFKKIYILSDWLNVIRSVLISFAAFIFALASLLFVILVIFDLGFSKDALHDKSIQLSYSVIFVALFCTKLLNELASFRIKKWFAFLFNAVILGGALIALLVHFKWIHISSLWLQPIFQGQKAIILWSLVLMVTETPRLGRYIATINISASFLFAGSFLLTILTGSGLLMLPNATTRPIPYINALFTATSAVCVTGLTVEDTSVVFTPIGKGIIMVLIQIGGLGIMTFTAFFRYIFLGTSSFKDRFMMKDLFSSENLSSLYKIVIKILLFTFFIEGVGVFLIYSSVEGYWLFKLQDATFHAISAFCNAGFSVYPEGFFTASIRFNYWLQLVICALIILGGIGFPLLLRLYQYLKYRTSSLLYLLAGRKKAHEVIRLSVGERLALKTTIMLILGGTIACFWFEGLGSSHSGGLIREIMAAFFASVSARTAGFNVVDLATWSSPTVFVVIFLMWVGTSPGSTGGGIKTTTMAVAVKSVISFLKGRTELEIYDREIGVPTVFRVFSIILLSMLFVFVGFMLLLVLEPTKQPHQLLFECVSAFSTTGLSIADTKGLTNYSKLVLIILMFVGRVSPVVLLSGFMAKKTDRFYRLPVEDIKIN